MARRRKRAHLAAVAPSMEPLRRPVYRRVRRRPDAAELAQEVYVRILRVPDLAAIRDPGAFLYTVASNLARDHARRERHVGVALDADDPLVQEQLAELPAFDGQLDVEQRARRLS